MDMETSPTQQQELDTQRKNRNRKILNWTLLVLVILGIVFFAYRVHTELTLQAQREELQELLDQAGPTVSTYIDDYYAGYDEYITHAAATGSCYLELCHTEKTEYYEWHEDFEISLYVDDAFDDLSDEEKYNYLKKLIWSSQAQQVVRGLLEEQLPDYCAYYDNNITYSASTLMYSKVVFSQKDYEITVITSQNTYRPSSYTQYYYTLNGEGHYVCDEYGIWKGYSDYYTRKQEYLASLEEEESETSSSSKSSKKSSSSSSKKKTYNVGLWDDYYDDDYAYDW